MLIEDDVDDQEFFLTAIKELTDSVIIRVLGNAKSALQILESKQEPVDLIFLDLNMPLMDGQDFLRILKKNEALKQIPVVVLSTTSHPITIKYAKELGALDFITKPTKISELKKILKLIINQKLDRK
jgi:CheY-like chemotaxis protein